MNIRPGDWVEYRTRPLVSSPHDPDDKYKWLDRFLHTGRVADKPHWLPALVLRVWETNDLQPPLLNLRVYQDGSEPEWRTTVPHEAFSTRGNFAWRGREERNLETFKL